MSPLDIRRSTANPRGGKVQVRSKGQPGGHYVPDPEMSARLAEALAMHRAGASHVEIARRFAIAKSTAQGYIRRAIQLWPGAAEDAAAVRETERKRLLGVLDKAAALYADPGPAFGSRGTPVTDPETGRPVPNNQVRASALRIMISASESLRKLYGADLPVPKQVDVTVSSREDRELSALVSGLIAAGHGEDVARSLLESLTETAGMSPVIAGEIETGPETP